MFGKRFEYNVFRVDFGNDNNLRLVQELDLIGQQGWKLVHAMSVYQGLFVREVTSDDR